MIKIPLQLQMKGFIKLEAVNGKGERRLLADWFPNQLLTAGMYEMSQRGDWLSCVQVGTDNTLPQASQTGLLGYLHGMGPGDQEENVVGTEATAPFFGWRRIRWRFPFFTFSQNENIAEIGVGWGTTNSANLVSRALVRDIDGNIVTVTVKADEALDVTYQFRYYVPTGDATGTVDFDGVTYNYIARAMNATDLNAWANVIGSQIASSASLNSDWLAYDGDIGLIDSAPSGLTADSDNSNDFTIAPVTTLQVSVGMICGPGTTEGTGWILTSGKYLRSLRVKTTAGWYQVQFDSQSNPGFGIPKSNSKILRAQFTLGWGEAP